MKFPYPVGQVFIVLLVVGRSGAYKQVTGFSHINDTTTRVIFQRVTVVLFRLIHYFMCQFLGGYIIILIYQVCNIFFCPVFPAKGHFSRSHSGLANPVTEEDNSIFFFQRELGNPQKRIFKVLPFHRNFLLGNTDKTPVPVQVVGGSFIFDNFHVTETVDVTDTKGRITDLSHHIFR